MIDGPAGSMRLTTDKEGIYDIGGLPPGDYQVRTADGTPDFRHHECGYGKLKSGDIGGCQLFAD
jgi:hypothetical protein